MTRVLVTGASGFVGSQLLPALARAGFHVVVALRRAPSDLRPPADLHPLIESRAVGDIGPTTDWSAALAGVAAVVHLAGPAHGADEGSVEADARHWCVSAEGTARLARAAAQAGVRRFVFASTVKAAGEHTCDHPWRESDPARPEEGYGRAKLAAERSLIEAARGRALEPVILRPPLVHGPNAKGNILRLLHLLRRGVPLPLAGLANLRSVISLSSLVDAIQYVLIHPRAAGQTYYLQDGALSTPEIVRALARGAGFRPRLFRAPEALLRTAARTLGRAGLAERLLDSLVVNDDKIRHDLGWAPRTDAAAALAATGAWFAHRR